MLDVYFNNIIYIISFIKDNLQGLLLKQIIQFFSSMIYLITLVYAASKCEGRMHGGIFIILTFISLFFYIPLIMTLMSYLS